MESKSAFKMENIKAPPTSQLFMIHSLIAIKRWSMMAAIPPMKLRTNALPWTERNNT
jgi:hypothetical protein